MHPAAIALAVVAVIAALVYMARARLYGRDGGADKDGWMARNGRMVKNGRVFSGGDLVGGVRMPLSLNSCMFRSRADCQKAERAHYKCKEYLDGCWYLVSVG